MKLEIIILPTNWLAQNNSPDFPYNRKCGCLHLMQNVVELSNYAGKVLKTTNFAKNFQLI